VGISIITYKKRALKTFVRKVSITHKKS
jgi:hypothetical protein